MKIVIIYFFNGTQKKIFKKNDLVFFVKTIQVN